MTIPSNIVGTVYKSSMASEGTVSQTATQITFTKTKALADQAVLGQFIGPNATATVTSTGTDATSGNPTITFLIGNSGTFADGQSISGVIIGNDATDFILSGNILGTQGFLYVTNTDAQQPALGGIAVIAAESVGVPYTPCYCAGTLIQTDRGEVAVETLAIGDRVMTVSGAARAIRWIGRRSFEGRFLAGKAHLLPIRIRAGALGDKIPRRDLLVSPHHAMLLDGLLVPAEELVNGNSIVQDRSVQRVDYFHIELESHDVIWAEGAASETFLDDDSRGMFHNAREYASLYPDAAPSDAPFCARRVTDGYELEAIRVRLAGIAGRIDRAA